MWLLYYFNFERNYDLLKSKNPCFLLKKYINLNKKKTESKMENPIHSFREISLLHEFMQESQIEIKTELAKDKREYILQGIFSAREISL